MIVIVDSGIANVGSIANMFKRAGALATISSAPDEVRAAEKLVLPGVGAFDTGMRHLTERGLVDALNEAVLERRRPVLGICLGMQLLARRSEEGQSQGLGWIDADVVRFRQLQDEHGAPLRVPHMGWNTVRPVRETPLFTELGDGARFYFVHSYHMAVGDERGAAGRTRYGDSFVSVVARDNIYGVQFHPEKSHRFGLQLLRNFAALS
jgi:imidazole glycerol-phosphate synthase subunit HisH